MKPIDNEQNNNKCFCPVCPVFNECSRKNKESAFCAKTKSSCIKEGNKPCLCPGCPVFSENNLSGAYFCLNEIN